MGTATITTRTRMLIQDTGRPFAANFTVTGQPTNVFDLPVESISSTANPPIVYVDGLLVPQGATPVWIMDYKHGVISFTNELQVGETVAVTGTTYDYFDDDEVAQAVTDGFNLHVQDQDPLPTIDPVLGQPSISSSEEYLVSILAAVELLWFLSTDASQIIDIHTPEGVFIPRSERFRQVMAQVNALQEEYKTIAGALGVGLWRIQILFQRRVSYTTNRLVPLFREQEYNQPYTGFIPTAAPVGGLVQIFGSFFTGTTAVLFGGVPSTNFNVVPGVNNEPDVITATVPLGAQTGQIQVVTPYGTVLSTAQFVVGQPAPFILYGPEMAKPPLPPGV